MGDDLQRLVARAASGDREAADALARRYEEPVRAAIHRKLGPTLRKRVDTDDVFQSTIAAAVEALPGFRFRDESALVRWLAAVGEMRVLQMVKHHLAAKRDPRKERPMRDRAGVAEDLASPPQWAARRELRDGIRRAVARLPDSERLVVEFHSFEGQTFQEVAVRLGLPNRQAAHHVFQRALSRVHQLLRQERGGARDDGASGDRS